MKLYLRDNNPDVVAAFRHYFKGSDDVIVQDGDIFQQPDCMAIVSPANSFGFMDGGIDLVYQQKMGFHLEKDVQAAIKQQTKYNEILVGHALAVETKYMDITWLIVAPTMRTPRPCTAEHVFLATRAAIDLCLNMSLGSVQMPGMGTATGRVPPMAAAQAMLFGYNAAHKLNGLKGIENEHTAAAS